MSQAISSAMVRAIEGSSWIRRMFEEGGRLKEEHGAENVCDFSLGNPVLEPPEAFRQALRGLVDDPTPGRHRYPPNAGLPEVRSYLAGELARETGLDYGPEELIVTCGAAGGLNIVLKALLDPGDEVVAFAPYFVEYDFYASNHGGRLVRAETDVNFQLDMEALEGAITGRTRAVIINSPNNPTGAVYPLEALVELAELLTRASRRHGRPIFLLSDEPYRRIVFDGVEPPWLPPLYDNTIVVASHSKDLGLAGERVGYAAVSPHCEGRRELAEAMTLANRVLGFVNAPLLIQRVLPLLQGVWAEVDYYRSLRDSLLPPLREMGYQVVEPQGAFYLFPRSPIPDDVAFVKAAQRERLLLVPGSGFARKGHFRIALCVTPEVIGRALPLFEKVLRESAG